jgi:hypothetical protein
MNNFGGGITMTLGADKLALSQNTMMEYINSLVYIQDYPVVNGNPYQSSIAAVWNMACNGNISAFNNLPEPIKDIAKQVLDTPALEIGPAKGKVDYSFMGIIMASTKEVGEKSHFLQLFQDRIKYKFLELYRQNIEYYSGIVLSFAVTDGGSTTTIRLTLGQLMNRAHNEDRILSEKYQRLSQDLTSYRYALYPIRE